MAVRFDPSQPIDPAILLSLILGGIRGKSGTGRLSQMTVGGRLGRKAGMAQEIARKASEETEEDPAAAAARRIREEELRRRGRRSMILTGPKGLLDAAPLSRPTALGG